MSCRAKAWAPASTLPPDSFTDATALSKICVPASSVLRKVSSSAYATLLMRSQPVSTSG